MKWYYAVLSNLFMKATNIKVLYTYIRITWAGQCRGWWYEHNQLATSIPSYVQLSKSGEEVTGYGTCVNLLLATLILSSWSGSQLQIVLPVVLMETCVAQVE